MGFNLFSSAPYGIGIEPSSLFRKDNIQPVKITDKRRIDGTVSLLNAWVMYVKHYEDFMYNVG